MESAQEKLIEALRKAISRTSMLAEGNNPELDSILQNIRTNLGKTQDEATVRQTFQALEPFVLKFDDERYARAQAFRNALLDLIDSLESCTNKRIPLHTKKQLESEIRSNWQSVSSWAPLLAKTVQLVRDTLSSKDSVPEKSSLLGRIFKRKPQSKSSSIDESEIMSHVSHTLAALLTNISLPESYEDQILDLKQALTGNSDLNQLPALLDEVINLIMVAVGKTQEDLTSYLSQLNKQLASINESIVSNYKAQRSISSNRKSFSDQLQQHVEDTNTDVQKATDLEALKSLINSRMSTISQTMDKYQTQMQEQEKQAAQSISMLKNKVNRMEQDASSLRTHMQQKIAQALSDSLTGLPNRAAYQEAIFPLLTAAAQNSQPLCIAICDIDHFKNINDTWGHLAGDKVLRLIPRQMQSVLDKQHLLFRYGGEEFIVVFPMTNIEQAHNTCEAIKSAVEKTPFNMHGEPVSITISIGVSQFDFNESHDDLFTKADKNLYIAKEQGRNKVIRDK